MHHPDICNIMLIIDDYFLLLDNDKPAYQLEPVFNNSNPNIPVFGIKIKRQLLNGCIHAEIYGQDEDDNTLALRYYLDESNNKPKKSITIENKMFYDKALRDAVRTILTLDKNPQLIQECDC